ncbi:MAG TPA: NB-ARC domain-containing protein [Chloroflexia bacterium]|nr:NB-ARC domain-containing protein [Chloroflexia bacterium]
MANIFDKETTARQIRIGIHSIADQAGERVTDTELEVAELLGISARTLQSWMNPSSVPGRIENMLLMGLAWLAITKGARKLEWLLKLLSSTSMIVVEPYDIRWARSCLELAVLNHLPISSEQVEKALNNLFADSSPESLPALQFGNSKVCCNIEDWDAVERNTFYGRTFELELLESWLNGNQCRLLTISGLSGAGKTWLALKLLHQIKEDYEVLVWLSLRYSPPLKEILLECLGHFDPEMQNLSILNINDLIDLLLQYLRQQRTLIVLDNFEVVLESNDTLGKYQPQYEGLGRLLRLVAKTDHKSCLLLTTREKPVGYSRLETSSARTRNLMLSGLRMEECRDLLRQRGLTLTHDTWPTLCELYSGNPQFLNLAAVTIKELFGGDVERFLSCKVAVFSHIRVILDQQVYRLTEPEKKILSWLSVQDSCISIDEVLAEFNDRASNSLLLESISSLLRRSLLQLNSASRLEVEPILREYYLSSASSTLKASKTDGSNITG